MFLEDDDNIHKPPCFVGEHYDFWKIRMQMFLELYGAKVCKSINNGLYIPTLVINGVSSAKPKATWDDEENKNIIHDNKAKNILASSLGMDGLFKVSNCLTAKEIWYTLEVTHEGTNEVKISRINTHISLSLSQEYETFKILPGEKILDLQKRFTHLINHLTVLGNFCNNDEMNLKGLKFITRSRQLKVTASSEKKLLSKINSATLLGKNTRA